MRRTLASEFSTRASSEGGASPRCIEILGGNVRRAETLLLGELEVLFVARPARSGGGGDIYCIHSCGHGALAKFVLLDLTGHGQERDAIARAVHDLLHRFGDETQPAQFLSHLNHQYHQLALPAILATAISAVCEPGRGEFRFANAGQPRPFHWSAARRQWTLVSSVNDSDCGLPLGVKLNACYTEENVPLAEGDMLVLSSDGLPEARARHGEFLRLEGVLELLEESTTRSGPDAPLVEPAAAFLRRVEEFRGAKEFADDITLLWARRLPKNGIKGAMANWT